MRGESNQPKDKRTKAQLLAALARAEETLIAEKKELSFSVGLLRERDDQLAHKQILLMASETEIVELGERVKDGDVRITFLSDENRKIGKELIESLVRLKIVSQSLRNEIEGRTREQVLLKALIATLGSNRFDLVAGVIQDGAETAGLDYEIAIGVADKYLRAEIVAQAERSKAVPDPSPATGHGV